MVDFINPDAFPGYQFLHGELLGPDGPQTPVVSGSLIVRAAAELTQSNPDEVNALSLGQEELI